jgi:hypothetical protein
MINDFTELLKSSIDKSVELKLFKTKEDSAYAHLYNFKLEQIPMSYFKKDKVKNFKSDRLKARTIETAYPEDDRPKGLYNVESVKYHMTLIEKKLNPLIWVVKKNNNYELIHGSHKIIAAHLAHLKKIDAYVINI